MKHFILIFLLLASTTYLKAQQNNTFIIPDTLKDKSFEQLEKGFKDNIGFNEKRTYYALAYYKKAKSSGNIFKIANGMFLLAYVANNDDLSLQYADSIITLTKNTNDSVFPAKGYILKSDFLLKIKKTNDALNTILVAEKYAKSNNNFNQSIIVKKNIALIKIIIGEYNEALLFIKECHDYYKSKNNLSKEYIYSTLILAGVYNRLKKPDLSLLYNNECLKQLKSDSSFYIYFILNQGISYNTKKEYIKSNQFLDKVIIELKKKNENINLPISYYFKGENILNGEKNITKAKTYFVKADSILCITKEYSTDTRYNYLRLIEITKERKEDKEQLYYLNRLLEIDDYLKKKNNVIIENIDHNYDTPHLLAQKEAVISSMNKQKYASIIIVSICIVALGILFLFYFIKNKREKKQLEQRFNALMQQTENTSNTAVIPETPVFTASDTTKTKSNEVPKEIEKNIIEKLHVFEKNKGYLKPNIIQTEFAKELNTNSTYLSIIINKYKGKNFSQYLNELRVDYAVQQLKTNKKWRSYSVKAISKEVGFSNQESFAKAFFTKTGIQPSYFMRRLGENIEF
jgi:AraC-like DNA-binding protein